MTGTALFFRVFIDPLLVTELSQYDILVPQTSCDNSLQGNSEMQAGSSKQGWVDAHYIDIHFYVHLNWWDASFHL